MKAGTWEVEVLPTQPACLFLIYITDWTGPDDSNLLDCIFIDPELEPEHVVAVLRAAARLRSSKYDTRDLCDLGAKAGSCEKVER